jgi:hypothetical protein
MRVSSETGMSDTYSLGNYEKQVLIELDNELIPFDRQRNDALWHGIKSLIELCYDSMLDPSLCKVEIKNLLNSTVLVE